MSGGKWLKNGIASQGQDVMCMCAWPHIVCPTVSYPTDSPAKMGIKNCQESSPILASRGFLHVEPVS
jgi:hypothetical protein